MLDYEDTLSPCPIKNMHKKKSSCAAYKNFSLHFGPVIFFHVPKKKKKGIAAFLG